jgi:tRNA threonylcarbamoyladenosine biosynthesis protein TsaE
MVIRSKSQEETQKLGVEMGKSLKTGLLCLIGELGAGKTTFVRGLAKGMGIKSRIQSPTFTYQRVHTGKKKLYHFDFYRINGPDQLLINDLLEAYSNNDGIVVIEWAEKLSSFFPETFEKSAVSAPTRKDIYFKYIDSDTREIKIKNYD